LNDTAQLILLALEVAERLAKVAGELKKQSGLNDEQILAAADVKDDDTIAKARTLLASLG
jgi:hypothetical protein